VENQAKAQLAGQPSVVIQSRRSSTGGQRVGAGRGAAAVLRAVGGAKHRDASGATYQ